MWDVAGLCAGRAKGCAPVRQIREVRQLDSVTVDAAGGQPPSGSSAALPAAVYVPAAGMAPEPQWMRVVAMPGTAPLQAAQAANAVTAAFCGGVRRQHIELLLLDPETGQDDW